MAQSTPVKRTPKKERDPKRIIAPLVVLAVIYIGLEIFLRVFDVAAYVMPTPTHIIQATISSFYIILPDFLFTLKIICVGFCIVVGAGTRALRSKSGSSARWTTCWQGAASAQITGGMGRLTQSRRA